MDTPDNDIPEQFRGDRAIVITEFEGSPLMYQLGGKFLALSKGKWIKVEELKPIATIRGISEEAEDRIAKIVFENHADTGVPVTPITRTSILRALVGENN